MARTLLQLTNAVIEACGFIPWIVVNTATGGGGEGEPSDLSEIMSGMMARLRISLGLLPEQDNPTPRTLSELRADMMRLLGYSAQAANPPPGMAAYLNTTINEAQQMLFRAAQLSQQGSEPVRLVADGDETTLDPTHVLQYAMWMAAKHYNKPEAGDYEKRAMGLLGDYAQRNLPNQDLRLRVALSDAQRTLARRYQVTQGGPVEILTFWGDGDAPTFDPQAVYLLALSTLKASFKQDDWKLHREDWQQYLADMERRLPANATTFIRRCVREANSTLFSRYASLRSLREITIPLVDGEVSYPLLDPDNSDRPIDADRLEWVGVLRDNVWYPLVSGFKPSIYTQQPETGWPTRYDMIDGNLRVWPTPGADTQFLVLCGRWEPGPFVDDADEPAVDDQAIFLHATIAAKQLYKQEVGTLPQDLDAYISERVAASHKTNRYVPGLRPCCYSDLSPFPIPNVPFE